MNRLNAEFTGQTLERIETDADRDRWFTAPEALEYGFVDHIITRAHLNGSAIMTSPTAIRDPIQARYILPSFIEHSSFGIKESNPYNKLFEERIIFLGVQVDDASANDIMAQLLVLESLDPDRDITMYINSPGGSFTSLMAIYDTMQYVRADIQTVCLGQAASAAAVLLAAGTPGKRMALPNARMLIHQPAVGGAIQGQVSDLEIQAAEIERMRTLMDDDAGAAHRQGRRGHPQGHRPRQDPDGRGGQGLRDHRHGPGVPEAVGAEGLDRGPRRSRGPVNGGDTPGTQLALRGPVRPNQADMFRRQMNTTGAIRLYRSPIAGISG